MYSNPVLIRLRSALRSVGILRLIQSIPFYQWTSQGHEDRFNATMIIGLKPVIRVPDIGANVGYYTQKFSEAVGLSVEVPAFEPASASAAKFSEN